MEGYVRFSSSSPPGGNGGNGAVGAGLRSPGPFLHHSPSAESSDSQYLDSPLPHHRAAAQQQAGSSGGSMQQRLQQANGAGQPPAGRDGSGSSAGSWRQRGSCGRGGGGSGWCSALLPLQALAAWWRGPERQRVFESNYMTLVPLSDARLKPRRTKLIVSTLLLLALLAVTGVFLLVPRGVSVGTIDVHSTRMTFNSTSHTYRIILQADVPIYNPNYLKASVTGKLTVSFYDAEAGFTEIGPVALMARSSPQLLEVNVDASNLPRKYTQVVYNNCFTFPRKLIFFLLGTFRHSYLGYVTELPSIDTYFMLDCSGAKALL